MSTISLWHKKVKQFWWLIRHCLTSTSTGEKWKWLLGDWYSIIFLFRRETIFLRKSDEFLKHSELTVYSGGRKIPVVNHKQGNKTRTGIITNKSLVHDKQVLSHWTMRLVVLVVAHYLCCGGNPFGHSVSKHEQKYQVRNLKSNVKSFEAGSDLSNNQ